MAFRVGQKVVYIDDHDDQSWEGRRPNHVREKEIYTIRWCGEYNFENGPSPAVYLSEVKNPKSRWFDGSCSEPAFGAERFRPLIEKSTDTGMAVLREILDRESYVIKTPAKA